MMESAGFKATREELLIAMEQIGSRNATSLYQQRPAPEEGDIFKWWPTYKALPRAEIKRRGPKRVSLTPDYRQAGAFSAIEMGDAWGVKRAPPSAPPSASPSTEKRVYLTPYYPHHPLDPSEKGGVPHTLLSRPEDCHVYPFRTSATCRY